MGKCVKSLMKVERADTCYAHSKSTWQFLRLRRNYRNRIQIEQDKNRGPDEQGPDKGSRVRSQKVNCHTFYIRPEERSENKYS